MNVGEIVVMHLVSLVDAEAAVPTRAVKFPYAGPNFSWPCFFM
jgi:hypothetical protein